MSEVKRHLAGDIYDGAEVVYASDFDNSTRLFLDAAERAVASERREKELQQRLTAADERADAGIAFVIRLIQCSEGQPSIATGYLRDILDVLKQTEGILTPTTCTWKFGAFSWHTACGQQWMLNDGTPEQNGMRFCHSCGNALVAEEPEDA
ncbi:hypothetical protein JFT61_19590 [Pseudomonas fluorescens]|nr:hypothetical protein [Pseudomonas fluorescens]